MDRDLIKDIVGRPKWWLINVPLMVLFLIGVTVVIPRCANGAPEPEVMICAPGEWDCYTAQRFAKEFKAQKYGNPR